MSDERGQAARSRQHARGRRARRRRDVVGLARDVGPSGREPRDDASGSRRAVAELDYEPDMLAQSLRRRETLTVGFVVGDISNPLFAEIVMGVESTLHRTATRCCSRTRSATRRWRPRTSGSSRSGGSTGSSSRVLDETHPETIDRLRELEIPVVVLDRNLPTEIPVSRVLSDHRSGMKAAVSHLLDLGHRRIALIGGTGVRPALERRAGLEQAFAVAGPAAHLHGRRGVVRRRARHGGDAQAPRSARAADGGDRRREPADAGSAPRRRRAGGRSGQRALVRRLRRRRDHRPLPAAPSRSSVATTSRWVERPPNSSSPACATGRRRRTSSCRRSSSPGRAAARRRVIALHGERCTRG